MEGFEKYVPSTWMEALRHELVAHPLYKPALLLTVLDAIDEGRASPALLRFDAELERAFDDLLRRAGAPEGEGKAWLPFFHLATVVRGRAPIWTLTMGSLLVTPGNVQSRAALMRVADGACFRPDLAAPLRTEAGRSSVREKIYDWVTSGSNPEAGLRLVAAHDPRWPAVEKAQALLREAVFRPFTLFREHPEVEVSTQLRYARDVALRLEVLPLYRYRCALCEMRLRYHDRYEATAAHVVPVRVAGVDDVRNALALCRTHHWAFDEGLWTIDETGRASVLDENDSDTVDVTALRPFLGKSLELPAETAVRPHPTALEWHRTVLYRGAAA